MSQESPGLSGTHLHPLYERMSPEIFHDDVHSRTHTHSRNSLQITLACRSKMNVEGDRNPYHLIPVHRQTEIIGSRFNYGS